MIKTNQKKFAVLGGDMRLKSLLEQLKDKPYCSSAHGLYLGEESANAIDILPQSDIIILSPIIADENGLLVAPMAKETHKIKDIFKYIKSDAKIFGGNIHALIEEMNFSNPPECFDYMKREEFVVENAIPTAEGAIEIAMRETCRTLYGSNCLVLGYGRIAKTLTKLLTSFGAHATVAARKESDLVWARFAGAGSTKIDNLYFDESLHQYDIIFNTIPALVIDEHRLSKIKNDCLIVDLASKPGGIDFNKAQDLNKKVIWALSLPGKCAPCSAGEIILNTIENILYERGFIHE